MLKEVKEIVNKQLLRQKPTGEQFTAFTDALRNLKDSIQPDESEEHNKNYILQFLRDAFYGKEHLVNTAGYIDGAIYQTKERTSSIEVIIEAKAPNNKTEFPNRRNLNCKAMQELVLYFMRARFDDNNISLKHLIMTNGYEWFIIDATQFEKHFANDKKFVRLFKEFGNKELLFSGTHDFYSEIAKPKIDSVKQDIDFLYFDIRALKSPTDILRFFRVLQPAHLLKSMKFTDTNKLNTAFYNELLYIIGLEEHKVDNKYIIERKPKGQRNTYSLLESTIYQLEDFGVTDEKEQFDLALNLVITWINRILFLKLLESQLISYHGNKHADEYRFLSHEHISDFDELNELFFKALAIPVQNRPEQVKEKFKNIPYLNSSLFELTENEEKYFRITGLKSGPMLFYPRTVLRYANGHAMKMEMDTLNYLFHFLDAYDFGSEQSDDITQSDSKTLINASVLGLIFEKINGYKDGSFFTPAFITQYMCREAIERTVIQKFNDKFGYSCKSITDIHNQDFDKQEAIKILDEITLCDPAVGSGHFLVSALNRLIAIRAELGLLYDENGKRLKDYNFTIDNDELIVTDEEGEIFHYNPNNAESQRVQKTLFELKRRIIENNLFGADINPNSVNICRLRLWIELLKNAFYREDTHELETLPNIDINIKCGDSLKNQYPVVVGGSINDKFLQKFVAAYKQSVIEYKQTSDKAKKQTIKCNIEALKYRVQHPEVQTELFAVNTPDQLESQYKHSLEWMIEYPEVLDDEGKFIGFDIIIGNPPYIQLQADKGKLAKLYAPVTNKKKGDSRNNYRTYAASGDIYCLFYERGHQLLKPNGILCFITSNKWMLAAYGEKTRQFLSTQTTPNLFIDFAGIKIFENATVDTNIILFNKVIDEQQKCKAVSCLKYKLDDVINLSDFVDAHNIDFRFPADDNWVIMSDIEQSIKSKVTAAGTPLKDWDLEIYRGVPTGFNDAFIIDANKRGEILANCQSEEERTRTEQLLWPILRGRDIQRYTYDWDNLYLIATFPVLHYNIDDYPAVRNYLLSFGMERLEQTGKKYIVNGEELKARKKTSNEWFEIQDSISYWNEFNKPKILWKRIGSILRFSYDDTRKLGLDSTCVATGTNIEYLCCILNSPMGHFLLKDAPKTGTGDLLISVQAVEPIRVPQIEDNSVFAEYLQRYIDGDTEVEKEINAKIYSLYNLSNEEIAYIEERFK